MEAILLQELCACCQHTIPLTSPRAISKACHPSLPLLQVLERDDYVTLALFDHKYKPFCFALKASTVRDHRSKLEEAAEKLGGGTALYDSVSVQRRGKVQGELAQAYAPRSSGHASGLQS